MNIIVTNAKSNGWKNEKIDFLINIGADKKQHGEGGFNLLHHLIGTRNIIRDRGGAEYLQDA